MVALLWWCLSLSPSTAPVRLGFAVLLDSLVRRIFRCLETKSSCIPSPPHDYAATMARHHLCQGCSFLDSNMEVWWGKQMWRASVIYGTCSLRSGYAIDAAACVATAHIVCSVVSGILLNNIATSPSCYVCVSQKSCSWTSTKFESQSDHPSAWEKGAFYSIVWPYLNQRLFVFQWAFCSHRQLIEIEPVRFKHCLLTVGQSATEDLALLPDQSQNLKIRLWEVSLWRDVATTAE